MKHGSITTRQNGYVFCFLGFQWHILHRLFEERKNNQQRLLLCFIGLIERRNHKKTSSFVEEKMHFFARQCNSSQIDENDGKNQWITLRIAFPLTLFSRSDKSYNKRGIEILKNSCTKCIELKWQCYREKINLRASFSYMSVILMILLSPFF